MHLSCTLALKITSSGLYSPFCLTPFEEHNVRDRHGKIPLLASLTAEASSQCSYEPGFICYHVEHFVTYFKDTCSNGENMEMLAEDDAGDCKLLRRRSIRHQSNAEQCCVHYRWRNGLTRWRRIEARKVLGGRCSVG